MLRVHSLQSHGEIIMLWFYYFITLTGFVGITQCVFEFIRLNKSQKKSHKRHSEFQDLTLVEIREELRFEIRYKQIVSRAANFFTLIGGAVFFYWLLR